MTNDYGFVGGMLEGMSRRAEAEALGKKLRTMVFDWTKATKILEERGWPDAEAGLMSDWSCTGGTIVQDKEKVNDSYTYLASFWATPAILIDSEYIPCWSYIEDTPGWDEKTKWPNNA